MFLYKTIIIIIKVSQFLDFLQRSLNTVNFRYLKVEVHSKLLIYHSKFSGPRTFEFRYQ